MTAERRLRQRFRIKQDISYKCLSGEQISDKGVGKMLDISSSGVRFTTERALNVGENVEVTINWPAMLDNKCLLKLVIKGFVVRSDSNNAAVKIEHHEFRTRASDPLPGVT